MTTSLENDLKRELRVGRDPYTLTISPSGLRLVPKGKRNGLELRWMDLVSGEAALAVALNASLARIGQFTPAPVRRRTRQLNPPISASKQPQRPRSGPRRARP